MCFFTSILKSSMTIPPEIWTASFFLLCMVKRILEFIYCVLSLYLIFCPFLVCCIILKIIQVRWFKLMLWNQAWRQQFILQFIWWVQITDITSDYLIIQTHHGRQTCLLSGICDLCICPNRYQGDWSKPWKSKWLTLLQHWIYGQVNPTGGVKI